MYVVVTTTRSGYVDDVYGPFGTDVEAFTLARELRRPVHDLGNAVVRDVRPPFRPFDPTAQAAEGEVSA